MSSGEMIGLQEDQPGAVPASSPRLQFVAVLPERVGHKMSNSILTKHQKNNQKITKQANKQTNIKITYTQEH